MLQRAHDFHHDVISYAVPRTWGLNKLSASSSAISGLLHGPGVLLSVRKIGNYNTGHSNTYTEEGSAAPDTDHSWPPSLNEVTLTRALVRVGLAMAFVK